VRFSFLECEDFILGDQTLEAEKEDYLTSSESQAFFKNILNT